MSRRRIRTRGRRQCSVCYQVGYIIGQALQGAIKKGLGIHSPTKEWQDAYIEGHSKEGKQ